MAVAIYSGIIPDYDKEGDLVRLEILDASQRVRTHGRWGSQKGKDKTKSSRPKSRDPVWQQTDYEGNLPQKRFPRPVGSYGPLLPGPRNFSLLWMPDLSRA